MSVSDFKEFVKSHELLKEEVRSGKTSWKKIYEDYTILGENDSSWKKYVKVNNERISKEGIMGVIDYVKGINPDNVSKTLNNISKIVSLIQGFGAGNVDKKISTGDPLFDKRFDDWY